MRVGCKLWMNRKSGGAGKTLLYNRTNRNPTAEAAVGRGNRCFHLHLSAIASTIISVRMNEITCTGLPHDVFITAASRSARRFREPSPGPSQAGTA